MSKDENTKTHDAPKVEISVRNFGPIAEADLDLRPLTVFVGPSNTGKTYLSVLIYALHRVFEDFSEFSSLDILQLLPHRSGGNLFSEIIKCLNVINKVSNNQSFKFSDLPEEWIAKIQSSFKNLENYGDDLAEELKRCFDLDALSELIQSPGGEGHEMGISLKVNDANQDLCNFDMGVSKSGHTVDGKINREMGVLKNPSQSSAIVYLPAARSGIMQSHRVIASSLIARSTRADLETLEVPTLSGVVADFMEHLILYERDERPEDEINHIADALASDVLNGQIITKPSPTGYPEFLYRPQGTGQDIRLTRSSSMVSELAPLVLFIRGLIHPGDTLIIEEPEAHLHPAAQAQMAATLARLVRAGVKVLVTTHSDFMLKEIANLMHAGELKEKGALKKQTNDWLLPEEVGTWLFQKNGVVEEIKFDRIGGIEPIEYEDIAERLYNRWAGLQNKLEELKVESELECE